MKPLESGIKARYGKLAENVSAGATQSSCCGPDDWCSPVAANEYDAAAVTGIPEDAVRASLGCGNPVALADLHEGDVVLDLGSGGGLDVLVSAKRVGPRGKVYGLDMTGQMLELARRNQRAAGADNVEFLEGEIETIPLPDGAVDVIISNCVINLSADKRRVFAEAFRVLRPGGRFAVSDIVVRGPIPDSVRRSMELWMGCVAGALEESEFRSGLEEAGFESVSIEPTRTYTVEDARAVLEEAGLDADALAPELDGRFMSAFVRALKPKACCC